MKKPEKKPKTVPTRAKGPANEKFLRAMAVVEQLNKEKGLSEGAKIHTGESYPPVQRIPTGILSIDIITGGGIPKQRFTQLSGPESTYKTTTLMHAVASCQRDGGVVAWVQGEEFDKTWARAQGADPSKMIIIPGAVAGDEALERAIKLIEQADIDLCIVDSVQGLGTTREMETDIGETGYGSGAPQMWGQFCKRGARAMGMGANVAIVWTSQMRAKIGGFMPHGADREEGSQIWALKHWKAVDLKFDRGPFVKDADEHVVAKTFKVDCRKNKTAVPHQKGEFVHYFKAQGDIAQGIDTVRELVSWGLDLGVIGRAGAWYTVGGERFNGADALAAGLRKFTGLAEELRQAILDEAIG